MKTTVEIPDTLFRRARKYCADKGIPFRILIEDGLRRALDPPRERAPFRCKRFGFRGEGPVGPTDWTEIREIIYEGRRGAPDRG